MENRYVEKIVSPILLLTLLVLSFFIIQPILLSLIMGFILAFILNPVYEYASRKTGSKNFATFISCLIIILFMIVPTLIIVPEIINQSTAIYAEIQKIDFENVIETNLPTLQGYSDVGSSTQSLITKTVDTIISSLTETIFQLPTILLHTIIIFFTFIYVIREKETLLFYLRNLLPFSKEVQERFLKTTKDVTGSVIYGQFIIGIVQGLIVGVGLFIFGVPNALILTIVSVLSGIIPIVGPVLVWIPVMIYMIISPEYALFPVIGFAIIGVISSTVDNFLKPVLVSRKTQLNTLLTLIGMIGGFFFFGMMGLVLGPLIIAYLLIVLDIYMGQKFNRLLESSDKKMIELNLFSKINKHGTKS